MLLYLALFYSENVSHFTSEILSLSLCSLIWKTCRRLWGPSSLSAATPCSIKLPCYSQDESPTGLREHCEVKTPPVPTKSRSGRQKVLETNPVRVTWQFSSYCIFSHQDLPLAFGKWCWTAHEMTFWFPKETTFVLPWQRRAKWRCQSNKQIILAI